MIRILIADDHKLFRETLEHVISKEPAFQVVASCGSSNEAIDAVRSANPDIVLMDINIQPFSGIEATQQLSLFSKTKVIGLSMHASAGYAKNMIKAGANGYITKNSSKEEIFAAITAVAGGTKYFCAEIKNLIAENEIAGVATSPVERLTKREVEIVHLITEGLTSKEIAARLLVATRTIQVHRHSILKKLQLKNGPSLVKYVHANAEYFLN